MEPLSLLLQNTRLTNGNMSEISKREDVAIEQFPMAIESMSRAAMALRGLSLTRSYHSLSTDRDKFLTSVHDNAVLFVPFHTLLFVPFIQ